MVHTPGFLEAAARHPRAIAGQVLEAGAALGPGLLLAGGLAGAAQLAHGLPGMALISPPAMAIGLGMLVQNVAGTPAAAAPGARFALKRLLRLAVVLLGAQLTFAEVASVGPAGFAVIAATLAATFFATRRLGRLIGVEARLAELIAAGTAVCGASAVMAANTVTRGTDEDVAYAIACVTVFGTASMLLMPAVLPYTGLDAHAYGLWTGAAIHEVAQVVAAASQDGPVAGQFGTVAKLSRVLLLAPLVLGLGAVAWRRRGPGRAPQGRVPMPWFVLGFIAMVAANSAGLLPEATRAILAGLTGILLTVALAAMGLETDIGRLRMKGVRPLLLGAMATLFISGLSFILIVIFIL